MSLDSARLADRSGDLQVAAREYEACVVEGGAIDAYVNLAVLYWQTTDFGFSTAAKLTPTFIAQAGRRFPELLTEAHLRFPGSTEVEFWDHYVRWADLGEDFALDTCRHLLERDPATLVPAMFLFAQTGECKEQAMELAARCRADGTTRARYIVSVVEGVLKRAR